MPGEVHERMVSKLVHHGGYRTHSFPETCRAVGAAVYPELRSEPVAAGRLPDGYLVFDHGNCVEVEWLEVVHGSGFDPLKFFDMWFFDDDVSPDFFSLTIVSTSGACLAYRKPLTELYELGWDLYDELYRGNTLRTKSQLLIDLAGQCDSPNNDIFTLIKEQHETS